MVHLDLAIKGLAAAINLDQPNGFYFLIRPIARTTRFIEAH